FPAAAPPLPTPTPRAESTTPTPTSSDAQIVAALLKRHRLGAAVVGLAIVGALAAVAWVSRRAASNDRVGSESFPSLEIQALTVNSGARFPAISPDGRFVAYTRGTNSVWVRQISVEHEVEVVPAVTGRQCKLLSFTPDGAAIDFVATDKD